MSSASTVYVPNSMSDAAVAFHQAADVDVMDMNTPYMNEWNKNPRRLAGIFIIWDIT